jgi:hypothetical protein
MDGVAQTIHQPPSAIRLGPAPGKGAGGGALKWAAGTFAILMWSHPFKRECRGNEARRAESAFEEQRKTFARFESR